VTRGSRRHAHVNHPDLVLGIDPEIDPGKSPELQHLEDGQSRGDQLATHLGTAIETPITDLALDEVVVDSHERVHVSGSSRENDLNWRRHDEARQSEDRYADLGAGYEFLDGYRLANRLGYGGDPLLAVTGPRSSVHPE